MERKNYKHLWMGTLVAALTFLITGYLYYNIMNDVQANSSDWVYKIIYTLIFSFGLSYLCWKTKRIGKSHYLTGIVIGLVVSGMILVASRLVYFQNNEAIVCCQGLHCWIWMLQSMLAGAFIVAASDGKTGGGSDD